MTDNISELTRFSGILRGQESFAQAVSFGLNTKKWVGGRVPLAVNTILLGQSSLSKYLDLDLSMYADINRTLGLAVYPTWLVVRNHVPVEQDTKPSSADTHLEDGLASTTILDCDEKEKFAVGKTSVGRDAAM